MKHDSASARLALKAGFLTTLAARAKELADSIESLALAHEWVEDLKEEIEDAKNDEDINDVEFAKLTMQLASKEARLADKRKQVDLLEARLRNFKDDVTCLGETL